ncbi:MAG TPA: hypothetical protein VFS00_33270, partial [Polyangiaceae bacterium]|nr:hypothetical protein [Polyangiaceae bacterium]
LSFDGGWTIEGTRWRRDCSPDARENTVLASPTTTGVSVRGAFGPIAFRNLSIATVAAAPPAVDGQPGASCYGLNASGAGLRLRLQNVELDACPGGEGGAVPVPTPPETFQCVETGAKCASGQPGADASGGGAPGERGTFGDEGFVHGDGAQGARGEPGAAGTAGPGQGEPLTCFVGGSGACCDALTQVPQGRCGCGGVAGFGGPGGRGGGASVALFVRGPNASVELAFATLRARDGGRGSPGAEGSPGSLGAPGAGYPGLAGCCAGCDGQCFLQACGDLPAQPAGGQGGKGGKGGKGGGGSGGPSFAFVGVGAELERSESVLSFGRPGAGAEGAVAGDAGAQARVSGPAPGETGARGAP